MLGRTHFFIGTAAALAVLQPQTVPVLVTGAGAAAIGSLISDIDVGTSQAHRDADKIITATVAVAALTILAEYKLNLGSEQNRCAMACQGCGAVFYFF